MGEIEVLSAADWEFWIVTTDPWGASRAIHCHRLESCKSQCYQLHAQSSYNYNVLISNHSSRTTLQSDILTDRRRSCGKVMFVTSLGPSLFCPWGEGGISQHALGAGRCISACTWGRVYVSQHALGWVVCMLSVHLGRGGGWDTGVCGWGV